MKRIIINNFRSFKNQEFNFSKVNILIGENNGGKSSFLKFLLLLKQTLQDKESNLLLNGKLVDLGLYSDIIHKNNSSEKLSFTFEFGTEYWDYYLGLMFHLVDITEGKSEDYSKSLGDRIGSGINFPTSVSFTMDENLSDHHSIMIDFSNEALGHLVIEHQKRNKDLDEFGLPPTCKISYSFQTESYTFNDIDYQPEGFLSKVISTSLRAKCDEQKVDSSIFYKMAFLLITQNYLKDNLIRINYVNPIDSFPERAFPIRETDASANSLSSIVNFIGRKDLNPEIRSKFLEAFNKAFSQFGLAEEIDVKRSDEFGALILRVKINGLWSNIKDVGYGVSLQIPIISQSLLANQFGMAEIVLIEQPEVHLHPRLQAKFISTLLEVDDYSSTYFIETHSEHIVRKLQSLVKNKPDKIKSEDISIHYFKRTQDKFEVTQHKINENYRLVPNLPKGFFDTSFEISKELL